MAGVCGGDCGFDSGGVRLIADGNLLGLLGHCGGALEFVPVEGLAVDGTLDGLEEDDGEELAVGEALDPDVEEQPAVAFACGVLALEGKCQGGCGEIDYQKRYEESQQLVEAVG